MVLGPIEKAHRARAQRADSEISEESSWVGDEDQPGSTQSVKLALPL